VTWVLWALVVVVIGGCVVVAVGRGGELAEAHDDRRDVLVPGNRPLASRDLRAVRFTTAFRGYRMAEVDALIARVAAELDAADRGGDPSDRPDPPDRPTGPAHQSHGDDVTSVPRRDGRSDDAG